ncbi:DUF6773 family protein [Clostridium sp.]|uniref:DUF6773 family protein n=1 Tax=Clostridium sp. TaxID=1506 RepID=UPI0028482D29|nr:DUF6773 family protein [Clostridium sp.]MDR3598488.1 hypothetical protein [Clostridium sp.]
MKNNISDERIDSENQKVNSHTTTILFLGLILDLIYKLVILKNPVSDYIDLGIILLIASLFNIIQCARLGLFNYTLNLKTSNKKKVLSLLAFSLVATFLFLLFQVISGQLVYINLKFIFQAIIFFIIIFLFQYLITIFSNKKNKD